MAQVFEGWRYRDYHDIIILAAEQAVLMDHYRNNNIAVYEAAGAALAG